MIGKGREGNAKSPESYDLGAGKFSILFLQKGKR